jgi:hypothetical protein
LFKEARTGVRTRTQTRRQKLHISSSKNVDLI